MANGDLAASVGMDTVAGSEDIRLAFDEENRGRDYLAAHRLTGTHPASAINSGTLPVVRGGTGRSNLYGSFTNTDANPSGMRLVVVDDENEVFSLGSAADIGPAYLGFQVHHTMLESVDFDANGAAAEPHGAPFTPTYITSQGLLIAGQGSVIVTPRGDNEPANSENVFLRAFITTNGAPYTGTLSKIMLLCMAVA